MMIGFLRNAFNAFFDPAPRVATYIWETPQGTLMVDHGEGAAYRFHDLPAVSAEQAAATDRRIREEQSFKDYWTKIAQPEEPQQPRPFNKWAVWYEFHLENQAQSQPDPAA